MNYSTDHSDVRSHNDVHCKPQVTKDEVCIVGLFFYWENDNVARVKECQQKRAWSRRAIMSHLHGFDKGSQYYLIGFKLVNLFELSRIIELILAELLQQKYSMSYPPFYWNILPFNTSHHC